mmetsp:Transcript_14366/g.31129  ORF Transcript_14366/g.31129 Transcript_14366/m.31129 type:complete len:377 (-) Transcript_14366:57-1187(-)|eukprot:CAMPEP_0172296946 /NCGR_PEP_ID=MMETSP1058-20130122/125_1 /TAXON_ID=83371 /ORGANISM="Detonula confervacea, Strain CCMP 353" /LENGTH=376 /DNA_ID=CAMNT_0013006027 /DNA_START=71 /DNA_END=1201 /DNA_ORIENTATION=-
MNLEKALVLLVASIGAVAGFAPSAPAAFTVTSQVSRVGRVAYAPNSALFSEVEEVAEATAEVAVEAPVEVAAEAPTEEAAPAAPAAFDTAIYVGNLSFDAVESELRSAFSEHGAVSKVQMPLDRTTGRSRGFAFVTMATADEHVNAIDQMNEAEVSGRTIYVSESLPKEKVAENKKKYKQTKKKEEGTKIYVGNLNFDTTQADLQATFEAFGKVSDCFIPSDFEGNPRGFAFIQMEEEDALEAIEKVNGTELDGRTLNVNKSLPKGTKSTPQQTKLYVGNLSWGTEAPALRELFEEYGNVVDAYIPVDKETGQHRGFAFVTMEPEDALRAADETDGYELDGRILRVNEAQPKGASRSNYNNESEGGDESWGNDEAY